MSDNAAGAIFVTLIFGLPTLFFCIRTITRGRVDIAQLQFNIAQTEHATALTRQSVEQIAVQRLTLESEQADRRLPGMRFPGVPQPPRPQPYPQAGRHAQADIQTQPMERIINE